MAMMKQDSRAIAKMTVRCIPT